MNILLVDIVFVVHYKQEYNGEICKYKSVLQFPLHREDLPVSDVFDFKDLYNSCKDNNVNSAIGLTSNMFSHSEWAMHYFIMSSI
jgi:hypothetical protein